MSYNDVIIVITYINYDIYYRKAGKNEKII